jgi:hypothetical protein
MVPEPNLYFHYHIIDLFLKWYCTGNVALLNCPFYILYLYLPAHLCRWYRTVTGAFVCIVPQGIDCTYLFRYHLLDSTKYEAYCNLNTYNKPLNLTQLFDIILVTYGNRW